MDVQVKAEWVAELRSGVRQQGKGALNHNNNKFCCLGVLCDLLKDRINGQWVKADGRNLLFVMGEYDPKSHIPNDTTDYSSQSYLPRRLREQLGIEAAAALRLARLNDEGRTFDEIANIIEQDM